MRTSYLSDLGAIGRRVLSGRRLTFSQRRAGFSVLASDVDEEVGVAAVWLVQAGLPGPVDYALLFERIDSWCCLGWSGGSSRKTLLMDRPSVADSQIRSIELLTSAASRGWPGRERQAARGPSGVADSADWIACAGFRLAVEAEMLQVGERLIRAPGQGYVIAVWESPARLVRPPIAALRKDASILATIGPTEHLDSLSWENIMTTLDGEPPTGSGNNISKS